MRFSQPYTFLPSINSHPPTWQEKIVQAVRSHNRQWLLASARQVFLSCSDSEWLSLEAFHPAIRTATGAEIDEWCDILFTRLQSSHLFPGGVQCHRLAWSFLLELGKQHFPAALLHMVHGLIPHEKDPFVFRAMGAYCREFPEDVISWGSLFSVRADFQSEPDQHIRHGVWQTFAHFCQENTAPPGAEGEDAKQKLWEITGHLLKRVLPPPGERSPLALSAAMNYIMSTSPALVFQLWDDIQLRVDPRHEPDWLLRQSVWEAFEGRDGSIQSQAQMAAHHLIDHRAETHPMLLRRLSVYGQQIG